MHEAAHPAVVATETASSSRDQVLAPVPFAFKLSTNCQGKVRGVRAGCGESGFLEIPKCYWKWCLQLNRESPAGSFTQVTSESRPRPMHGAESSDRTVLTASAVHQRPQQRPEHSMEVSVYQLKGLVRQKSE